MKIHTLNSIYEFDSEHNLCRRTLIDPISHLRKDGEWTKYYTVHYEVGEPMRIILEHLNGDEQQVTLRTTSTVLKVEK